ncbi:flagellar filament capping protein FliD [Pseudomonas sp. N3-W]|uniref:flagellar filament capping protein FliD n=1 Tax=Pseudomonas sp. N3-W TaxID=2975049 RepID=UPI00217EEABD|nr:flagellar filament capping protein FliD [Pseudomonas sp. N3-W]UWF50889.1 flagellar filament capping protein FliD [Pseudomonas sp. N3-W]
MASPILPGTGLGSGLDIGSIVTALVNADKSAKQTQITDQTTTTTAKISATGAVKSALTAFQTALTTLGSTSTPAFAGFSATSGTPTSLSVTSDNTAVNGSYNVLVTKLATGSKVATAAFSGGASSAIPTGTLTISQNGIAYPVTVAAGATLQSTRDAINSTLQTKGITANIVTDANGSRLVVGSTTTGAGSDISMSGIAGLEVNGATQMDGTATGAGYIGALAQDASYSVDGLAMTSKSNTISGAVGGISMTLLAANPTVPVVVTVGTNSDGLKTSLQSFIDAYNKVISTLTAYTTPSLDSDGNPTVSNAMTGDSLPRNLIQAMRDQLTTVPSDAGGSQLAVLAQLGITTDQKAGTLSLDTTKFADAMTNKGMGGQVQALFSGTTSTNGLLARMSNAVNPYSQTGGILDQRTTTLNMNQSDLTNQQAALDLRVTNLTASLTAKYNAMDLLVGQMKATAANITGFFASLNAQKSS